MAALAQVSRWETELMLYHVFSHACLACIPRSLSVLQHISRSCLQHLPVLRPTGVCSKSACSPCSYLDLNESKESFLSLPQDYLIQAAVAPEAERTQALAKWAGRHGTCNQI